MGLYHKLLNSILKLDAIPALLIRLFLAPVFIIAGYNKLQFNNEQLGFYEQLFADPSIIAWFGNTEWGLGLPFPEILANLAAWSELLGGWFLLLGLFTRVSCLPLMFTMIVAATSVHLENGWYAIAPTNSETSSAQVPHWLGIDIATKSLENSNVAATRLTKIKDILEENGNPNWLYETGNVVILNNGIEFAATYFIMLLALFFIGAGRWVSVDYWLVSLSERDS